MKNTTFRGPFLTLTVLALASGCTPHDDAQEQPQPPKANPVAAASSGGPAEPEPEPEPEPEVETVAVAVASVQLQDDCPVPAGAAAAPAAERGAQGARARPSSLEDAPGDVAEGDMPPDIEDRLAARCVQSEFQLSITSKDSKALPFSIKAVRLRKGEGGEAIETMTARTPRIWGGSTYASWDESIAPGKTLNVRYALGAPDWASVEKALEESSWGPLYVVELDVEVAGRVQTISSPLAPREAVEEMVT